MPQFKILVILTTTLIASTIARAEVGKPESCSASSIAGAYGFTLTGSDRGVLYAISGRFTSKGNGSLTGSATQTVGGDVFNNGFTALYSVDDDCTGTAKLTFDGGIVSGLNFTIVSDGREILMIDTDAGTVESGSAQKQ